MAVTQFQDSRWYRVLAPWASNDGARLYTYMLPPGIQCSEGDTIMVEGPKGQPKFLTAKQIVEHTSPVEVNGVPIKCKPIALVIPKADWEADQAKAANERTPWSHHPDFPKWVVECEDMYVEGR